MNFKKIVLCLLLLFLLDGTCHAEGKGPCQGNAAVVIVDTGPHKLWLCEDSKVVREFKVALGKGGIDKRKRGDNKTPLGEYSLGTPQPSNKFGIFIPIGYPTGEQRANGYTGSDVGIHGPSRICKWLGRITTWFDWTQGCIAIGTDDEVSEIARWMKQKQVRKIIIK